MEVTKWRANGAIRKGRARRMEKEVPRRPWWRGGTEGRHEGEEGERRAHRPRANSACWSPRGIRKGR